MQCANFLCFYEKSGKCIPDDITLNECGYCRECIYINVDKKELSRPKKETTESVEKDY